MRLTDPKVFEAKNPDAAPVFLRGAMDVADVVLSRTPVGGIRNADGSHLGDALTNVERRFVYHSPDGFEWGYGGSGPADLALNILGAFVDPPEAWRLHQDFKREVVARIPREGGVILAASVRDWIREQWRRDGR